MDHVNLPSPTYTVALYTVCFLEQLQLEMTMTSHKGFQYHNVIVRGNYSNSTGPGFAISSFGHVSLFQENAERAQLSVLRELAALFPNRAELYPFIIPDTIEAEYMSIMFKLEHTHSVSSVIRYHPPTYGREDALRWYGTIDGTADGLADSRYDISLRVESPKSALYGTTLKCEQDEPQNLLFTSRRSIKVAMLEILERLAPLLPDSKFMDPYRDYTHASGRSDQRSA